MQCRNNLHQIGIALHNYHYVYGSFPPAVTYDDDGRPTHSWRALIWPFLDDAPGKPAYDISQPWDSPENRALADETPYVFRCPSRRYVDDAQNVTSYVAVTGDGTCLAGAGNGLLFSELTDGTSNTFLLVECDAHNTVWTKPEDLTFDEALERLTNVDPRTACGHHDEDFFYKYHHGRFVMFGDGSIDFASAMAPRDYWQAGLLATDDKSPHDVEFAAGRFRENRVIRTRNWIRLGCFVIVALFPLPWVWLNPTSRRKTSQRISPR